LPDQLGARADVESGAAARLRELVSAMDGNKVCLFGTSARPHPSQLRPAVHITDGVGRPCRAFCVELTSWRPRQYATHRCRHRSGDGPSRELEEDAAGASRDYAHVGPVVCPAADIQRITRKRGRGIGEPTAPADEVPVSVDELLEIAKR